MSTLLPHAHPAEAEKNLTGANLDGARLLRMDLS